MRTKPIPIRSNSRTILRQYQKSIVVCFYLTTWEKIGDVYTELEIVDSRVWNKLDIGELVNFS